MINIKYTTAREKGIEFIVKIFISEDLPFNQCDISVVLGNATEATEKCENCEKKIEILMGIKKEALVLVVKNPYENILDTDKSGNLLSTKKDSHKQGYGISSIAKVAEKYSGDAVIDDENGQFIITITMNLERF